MNRYRALSIALLLILPLAARRAEGLLKQPDDPATDTTYGCHWIHNYNWNYGGDGIGVVVGKIRFPLPTCDSADGPPDDIPLIVFAHGNAMTHTDHDYLMAHLARNGFVTVSIANSGDNETRASQMISYLNAIHAFWPWKDRLSDEVVFMGHSRGGEAAVAAARLLAEEGLGAEAYDVKAVISIAPTDGGGQDGNDPREELTGDATESFLALYGSRDKDVTGSEADVGMNLEPQKTAFAIYDRAGSEVSQEGLGIVGLHLDKAFVFLYTLGHKDFLDADAFGSAAGQAAAKAYATAFLRWQVFGETEYRGFFDGTWKPESLAATELFNQVSSGTRRVLDNFEDGDEDTNYQGDTVTTSAAGFDTFEDGQLHELLRSSPHAGGGLRIAWTEPTWIRWGIPDEDIFFVGNKRDVSSYTHLSLRVSQVYADALNTEGEDQDFQLRIFTGSGFSAKVPVSLHGRVPYPDEFQCSGPPSCGFNQPNDFTKSGMTTLRVPLSAFGNVDFTDVRSVYLYFDLPEHPQGALTLDSLEFVQ